MKIENREELEKLIKLMRKTGVKSLEFNELGQFALELGPQAPIESAYKRKKAQASDSAETPTLASYSAEDIAFWSSTPPGAEPKQDS